MNRSHYHLTIRDDYSKNVVMVGDFDSASRAATAMMDYFQNSPAPYLEATLDYPDGRSFSTKNYTPVR